MRVNRFYTRKTGKEERNGYVDSTTYCRPFIDERELESPAAQPVLAGLSNDELPPGTIRETYKFNMKLRVANIRPLPESEARRKYYIHTTFYAINAFDHFADR